MKRLSFGGGWKVLHHLARLRQKCCWSSPGQLHMHVKWLIFISVVKKQILNCTLSGIWFWYFSKMISLPFQSGHFSYCLFFLCVCDRSNVLALDWACLTLQCSVLLAQEAVTIRADDALNPQGSSSSSCHAQGAAESPQRVSQHPSGVSPVLCFGQRGLK